MTAPTPNAELALRNYLGLGELIARLEQEDPARVLPFGFADPHSFRGYYHDLAFEPRRNISIGDMLAAARSALGATYEGYKGGDYTMADYTDCWIANYGESSDNKIGPLLLELLLAQRYYGSGCRCSVLGEGTPEHSRSSLCLPDGGAKLVKRHGESGWENGTEDCLDTCPEGCPGEHWSPIAPCQDGCREGRHLPGCVYAETEVAAFEVRQKALDRLLPPIVAPGTEMQPPPCADHQSNELGCPVCSAQRRAFYAALGREADVPEATS